MNKTASYHHHSRLGSIILVLTISACASSVPQIIKNAPANNPSLQQVLGQPQNHLVHLAQQVRWGGVIINTENMETSTRLTILAMALDDDGKPKSDGSSLGRFVADFSGFLEPSVYANSRIITIIGNIQTVETLKVGEYPYPHPVVGVRAHYLWPQPKPSVDYDWPYYWYDPWYYPYHYPYRPHRLHRR